MDSEREEMLCTPCESARYSKPAVRFCMDCDELLCRTCANCHMRFKSTKAHKLLRCDKREDFRGAQLLTSSLVCPKHTDKLIEVRCEEHEALCCLVCATITHRNCRAVSEIKYLADGIKTATQTKNLRKRIEMAKTCIEEILRMTDENEKEFEASVENIPDSLADLKAKLMNLYDKIEKQINEKVKTCEQDFISKTKTTREIWMNRLKANDDLSKMLETVLDVGSNSQVYISVKNISKKLAALKKDIDLLDEEGYMEKQSLQLEIKRSFENFLRSENIRSRVDVKTIKSDDREIPRVATYLIADDDLNDSNMASDSFQPGESGDIDWYRSRQESRNWPTFSGTNADTDSCDSFSSDASGSDKPSPENPVEKEKSKYQKKKEKKLEKRKRKVRKSSKYDEVSGGK